MKIQDILTSDVAKAALQDTVSLVAPRVSKALSGKAGGVVTEAAVRAVSRELLGTDTPEPQRLSERLSSLSAEDQAKLAEIDAQLATETAEIAAADRANARAREIETGDKFPMYLAIAVGSAFVAYLTLLVFKAPPDGSASIVFGGAGTLGTAFIATITYYFGSSRGSKIKDNLLAGFKRGPS